MARYITGRHIRVDTNGDWIVPRSKEVLREAGLLEIDDYIDRRRMYLANSIKDKDIITRCKTAPPHYSNTNQVVWWELVPNQG